MSNKKTSFTHFNRNCLIEARTFRARLHSRQCSFFSVSEKKYFQNSVVLRSCVYCWYFVTILLNLQTSYFEIFPDGTFLETVIHAEAYSEPCQSFKMDLMVVIIVNGFNYFPENSDLDVWLGSKYASGIVVQ